MMIPNNVQDILRQLHNQGHEAYIVGGCVRDMILGIEPYDYDITTSAGPDEVKRIFDKTIDTGIEHGTVTVMLDQVGYEVTTYRIDGKYRDHRRPESVSFTKSLEEDLKRRDFTINAMAYNQETGIVDLYKGQEDLKAGVIRCVGVAEERFDEDGLRMLRAIRFAARFGFTIDEGTEEAIRKQSALIEMISAERIHVELTKTLCSPNPAYMDRLVSYGLLQYIIPEFMPIVGLAQNHPYHIHDVDRHTYECLPHVAPEESLRWAMYLHDIGKGYTKTTDDEGIDHFFGHVKVSADMADTILKRLKFDNKTRKKIRDLIAFHGYRIPGTFKAVRRAMSKVGEGLFPDFLAIQYADVNGKTPEKIHERVVELEKIEGIYKDILQSGQCTKIGDLAIGGRDLLDQGYPKGPIIGEVLQHLLDLVLEVPEMNERQDLLDAVHDYMTARSEDE